MEASVNTCMQIFGISACVWVAVCAMRDVLGWHRNRQRLHDRRLAERRAFQEKVTLTARRARLRDDRGKAWEGQRLLKVVAVVDECRDVKSFYLAEPDSRPLPGFLPGQHVTLHLPVNGAASPAVRCYSLSDRPREESYRLTVKRSHSPAGESVPPGVASNWMHDNIRVGDNLLVGAPSGDFHYNPALSLPVVLIGGGIGVTPILSMALELTRRPLDRDIHLIIGVRNSDEFPHRAEIEALRNASPRLRVTVAYSRPEAAALQHRDYQHQGHADINLIRSLLPSSNHRFYLCGPPAMMQTLVPELLTWGVPGDDIHFEAFGPASVPRPSEENLATEAAGLLVRFARRDAQAVWPKECQTLLELAESAGVPIESGCRVGNCGRCATPVVEGAVRMTKRPGAPPPPGECLACISVPTSPLVLDA